VPGHGAAISPMLNVPNQRDEPERGRQSWVAHLRMRVSAPPGYHQPTGAGLVLALSPS